MGDKRSLPRKAVWRAAASIPVFLLAACGAENAMDQGNDSKDEGTLQETQDQLTFGLNKCPTQTLKNGSVKYSTSPIKTGTVATYSCSKGYTLSGSSTRTCQYTGSWNGTAPTCTAVPTKNVTQVAPGSNFTCALISDGTVQCWGVNDYGQLGDRTSDAKLAPSTVYGLVNAQQIASNVSGSCARISDGTVRCWGNNEFGLAGDGTTDTRYSPSTVSGITSSNKAIDVATDGYAACAVLADNTVKCWGDNRFANLGSGPADSSAHATPVTVSSAGPATQISMSGGMVCARQTGGTVKCWGSGWFGGTAGDVKTSPYTIPNLSHVVRVSANANFVCALLDDQTVKCWGVNGQGEIGQGNTYDYYASPTLVSSVIASEMGANGIHACALLGDKSVKCWGGDGLMWGITYGPSPAALTVGGAVAHLAVGYDHNCVILVDHTVQCWGNNMNGQLGGGATGSNTTTPVTVVGLPK